MRPVCGGGANRLMGGVPVVFCGTAGNNKLIGLLPAGSAGVGPRRVESGFGRTAESEADLVTDPEGLVPGRLDTGNPSRSGAGGVTVGSPGSPGSATGRNARFSQRGDPTGVEGALPATGVGATFPELFLAGRCVRDTITLGVPGEELRIPGDNCARAALSSGKESESESARGLNSSPINCCLGERDRCVPAPPPSLSSS